MSDKIEFIYERVEPFRYPEPRTLRRDLILQMCKKYHDKLVSEIPLETDIILKSISPKTEDEEERIILRYKVINIDHDVTKKVNEIKFERKMFKWARPEEFDYE
jgi:hypothetical protein